MEPVRPSTDEVDCCVVFFNYHLILGKRDFLFDQIPHRKEVIWRALDIFRAYDWKVTDKGWSHYFDGLTVTSVESKSLHFFHEAVT